MFNLFHCLKYLTIQSHYVFTLGIYKYKHGFDWFREVLQYGSVTENNIMYFLSLTIKI